MRKKIVAGNWKMNLTLQEAKELNRAVEMAIDNNTNCEVYQFAPFLYLQPMIENSNQVIVGAQNGHPNDSGAFTGEISISQLANIGTKAILIGHSERRQLFNESHSFLKEKVDSALKHKLTVFFCCGESLAQRESGDYKSVILNQLKDSLFHVSAQQFKNVIIAYEPIWAIGTGKTATPVQANEIHQLIREAIASHYSQDIANETTILYGGSCNPNNANDLFAQSDIDGGLIGGASLKPDDFLSIISVFN